MRRWPRRERRGGSRRRAVARRAGLLGAAVALLIAVAACGAQRARRTSAALGARPASAAAASPDATFTLLAGGRESLARLRGRPVLLWFIASGCASCAVSIPAVGRNLSEFSRAHVRILALGIYGSFGQGEEGLRSLARFARAAAGASFKDRAWSWGVASATLTERFDPSGVPDRYFLLDRSGQVVFQGSTPVWTLRSLLDHLKEVA